MSSIKLGDSLMKVPTLDVAGLNWVIYKDRFLWSIDARGLLDHVDGSALEPARPVLRPRRAGPLFQIVRRLGFAHKVCNQFLETVISNILR